MNSARRFSILIILVLAVAALFASLATRAQDINLPPRQDSQSATGVSFKTGSFFYKGPGLSIGGAFPNGLQLTIDYQSSRLGGGIADVTGTFGWSHNFVGMLSRNPRIYGPDEFPPPDPKKVPLIYTVSVGPQSFSFVSGTVSTTVPGPIFRPMSLTSATLAYTVVGNGLPNSGSYFTLTMGDGSVAIFTWLGNGSTRIDSWTTADGTRLDFTYYTPGSNKILRSVFSSRGYALLFEGNTKVCAVNLAQTNVNSSSSCPSDAQALSFSYSPSTYIPGINILTGITDAAGNTTTYSYIGADHLGCVKLPGHSTCQIQNTYDECVAPPEPPAPANLRLSDHVISQTTGTGESYTYSYQYVGNYSYCTDFTGYGAITTMTGPNNAVTVVYTNGAGMPTGIVDPLNRTTALAYEDNSTVEWEQAMPSVVTLPEGNRQYVLHDERGNVVEKHIIAKPGSGLADQVMTASYPTTCTNPKTCNKSDFVIDAKGNRIDYTYDPNHGGILTETRPPDSNGIRPQKRYSYSQLYAWIKDSSGNFTQASTPAWLLTGTSECMTQAFCTGTADEIKTSISYGSPGTANNLLPTVTTVGSGDNAVVATTTSTYDFTGNLLTVDGPLPGSADTTRTRYDALRRVVGEISADPDGAGPLPNRATRNTYDSAGRLVKVEKGTVSGQSDAEWATFAALESIDTLYDVMGRVLRVSKSGGGTVFAVAQTNYDGSGRPQCAAVRMDPSLWNSQSDACFPQASGPNGPDRIARTLYDLAGQVIIKQVAVGTADQANDETYTYTPNGKPATVQDGENNRTTYEYDGFDRLSRTLFPVPAQGAQTSSTSDFEQLTYDANNNVTQRRLRDGQIINSIYDALNRPILKDLPNPEVDVSYFYDLQGKTLTSTQGSAYVSASYDALGRMLSEVTTQGVMSYQYDSASRRTRTTWSDGFFVTQDFLTTGEVSAIRENGATSGVGVLATYGYDSQGQRLSINRGNGTTSNFTYDPISRLESLGHNLSGTAEDVTSTFSYNPASQIVTWTRDNDTYLWVPTNQSKISAVNGLNQLTSFGGTSIGYDARGNLTSQGASLYSYTVENRLVNGPNGASFNYDPIGRLSQSSGASGTIQFQYDGTDLTAEHSTSGQLQRRYVHGPGADEPLVWYEGSNTSDRRWFHQDERASIVALSNSAGATVAINTYDEYGIPAPTNLGRFQYTGQTWMPDLQMYYYKARVYSPTLGRFLQTDPIGYGDGINWYAYVGSDPIDRTDQLGLFESPSFLRSTVPGQVSWDNAITDYEQGRYGWAVVHTGSMVAEQVMFVLSLGTAAPAQGAINQVSSNVVTASARELNASRGLSARMAGIVFEGHHSIPKVLGGPVVQKLETLTAGLHGKFHEMLRAAMKSGGFDLPIAGRNGSAEAWARYFEEHPGSMEKAHSIVRAVSKEFDKMFDTNLSGAVKAACTGTRLCP